ncbi:MAG: GNAT family N-acetyltransferase [Caldilineaceae bacterium]
MNITDLPTVVDIHITSFPGFFLTFLGRDFLTLLYHNINSDEEGIVLVAGSGDAIYGFVAGVTNQSGFYARLIKRQVWGFALAGLNAAIKQPKILPRLFRALNRSSQSKGAATKACLMSIAVRPNVEGRGMGRELVNAFCQSMVERGVDAISLTTDRDDNERVNHFYLSLGFTLNRVFETPEGRTMNEYVKSLRM